MVNSALPVDPGSYQIEASADGFKTWSKTIDVEGEGTTITVAIPTLEKAPEKPRVNQDTGTGDVTGSSSTKSRIWWARGARPVAMVVHRIGESMGSSLWRTP